AVISTHSTHIFVFDVVSEGNGRLARVGFGFRANLQLPVDHDPLGGQFQIFIVRKAQFAVDRQTAHRRRTDIEDTPHVSAEGARGASGWPLLVGQGGWIGPAPPFAGRRTFLLSPNDGRPAEEQKYW